MITREVAQGRIAHGNRRAPRRILVLGWSHKVPALLREFGTYGGERYEVDVASVVPIPLREQMISRREMETGSIDLRQHELDYTLPQQLREMEPDRYDSVVLVATDRFQSDEEADARTILGLLLLQDLLPEAAGERPQTPVELHDPENVPLLEPGMAEVIISPVLVSHMLAQVALRRELRAVFEDLFTAGGADLTFRSPEMYGVAGKRVAFRELEARARRERELALGVLTVPSPGREEIDLAPPGTGCST